MSKEVMADEMPLCPDCDGSLAIADNVATCTRCGSEYSVEQTPDEPQRPPPILPPELPHKPAAKSPEKQPIIATSAPDHPKLAPWATYVSPGPELPSTASVIPTHTVAAVPPELGPGQLRAVAVDEIVQALKKQEIPTNINESVEPEDFGLNQRIKTSTAWRYAHELGKTGNPYRKESVSWLVYNCYVEQPRTIVESFLRCVSMGMDQESFSFLINLHHVTVDCLGAGLLVMDKETRKIKAHDGVPIAAMVRGR